MTLSSPVPTYTSLLPVALCETAFTVIALADETAPPDAGAFRQQCSEQILKLRFELSAAGHSHDVVEDAIYAQCALLDEAALANFKGTDRRAWLSRPLRLNELSRHGVAEELITRIERLLAQREPPTPLLASFLAVLDLGFKRRLPASRQGIRKVLMQALEERLNKSNQLSYSADAPAERVENPCRCLRYLSQATRTTVAILGAGTAYFLLDQLLGAAIAWIAR